MKNRILSTFWRRLVAVAILTMLPVAAFAASGCCVFCVFDCCPFC